MINRRDFLKRMFGGIVGTVAVACAGTAIAKNIVSASKPENRFDVMFKKIGSGEIGVVSGCMQMRRWKMDSINNKTLHLFTKEFEQSHEQSHFGYCDKHPDSKLIRKGFNMSFELVTGGEWDKIKHLA